MVQVKVFEEEDEEKLTTGINDFLYDNEELVIHDIKFTETMCFDEDEEELIYSFSALLLYSS